MQKGREGRGSKAGGTRMAVGHLGQRDRGAKGGATGEQVGGW